MRVNGATCTALQNNGSYQWINCSNNQAISGATQQTFTATNNGDYACMVSLGNCADTSNCVSVTGLSIEETVEYHFTLYPNPTGGMFTIEHNYSGEAQIKIESGIGNAVKSFNLTEPEEQFDISNIAAGVYEVFISTDDQLLGVVKLVKQ